MAECRIKTQEEIESLLRQYQTVIKISRATGISKSAIYGTIRRYGLQGKILHPAQNHKYAFNDSFFETIDTEEKAYWLGVLMADGNVSDFNRKSYTIRLLFQNCDAYHVANFCKAIDLDYQLRYDKYGRASMKICSKKMYFDLLKHGVCPKKSGKEIIPEMPSHLIRHFIRGFFDGDGTIYERNQNGTRKRSMCVIGFVCMNRKFMEDLINLLVVNCGVTSTHLFYKPDGHVYEWKSESINVCKRFIDYIYKDATIYMERKHERAMNFLKKLSDSGRMPRKP